MKAWYDERMRDLSLVEVKMREYLLNMERTRDKGAPKIDDYHLREALAHFEASVHSCARFITKTYADFLKMGDVVGNA